MIRTQVYIPDDLYHRAKLLAELEGISISELLRRELKVSVERKRKSKKRPGPFDKYIGAFSTGKKNVNAAVTHNDIYDHVMPGKPAKPKRRKKD